MINTTIARACLALMILIALAGFTPPHFQPITALDNILKHIGDQTNLMQTLHEAERSAS